MILEHYLAGFQYAVGDLTADATPQSGEAGSDDK